MSPRETHGIVQPETAWNRILRVLLFLILALFALYYLLPLIVMVSTSLKSLDEIRGGSLISLPRDVTFDPWGKAWDGACVDVRREGLRPYMWNSVVMVVPAVLLSTFLGSINGYALTKWRFPGANAIFSLMLFGAFIPFQVILLPMARVLGALGLAGTVSGLVLVHTIYGLAFTTLVFRNFFVGVSNGIVQAATIDGAGFLASISASSCRWRRPPSWSRSSGSSRRSGTTSCSVLPSRHRIPTRSRWRSTITSPPPPG